MNWTRFVEKHEGGVFTQFHVDRERRKNFDRIIKEIRREDALADALLEETE